MDNPEYDPVYGLTGAVEQIYRMEIESFRDIVREIISFYMDIFGREVIRMKRSGRLESYPVEWGAGKYSIFTSATMYSDANEGIYSIGIRFMEDYDDILSVTEHIKSYPSDCDFVFPEVVLDLTENGWEARIVLVDLFDPEKPSEVFAIADNREAEILHPIVGNAGNFLDRVRKNAEIAYLLSGYNPN